MAKDLINTAKYDKGPDNPKPYPNIKSFVVLCYGTVCRYIPVRFQVLCRSLLLVSLLWYDSKFFVVLCGVQ